MYSYPSAIFNLMKGTRTNFVEYGMPRKHWDGYLVPEITDSSFNGTLIETNFELMLLNEKHKGKYRWKFMDMKIFSFYKSLVFHFLYSSFNEKVLQLTSGGFFDL